MSHYVIYVPGLGDTSIQTRQLLVASWKLYGVVPIVHQMNWADKQPFEAKFQSLLAHIDELTSAGHIVSLVGESAGASTAVNAYAARPDSIHRVSCICGKLRNAQTISTQTYAHNPAFQESMSRLPESLSSLAAEKLARVQSVHPLWDPTVPVQDTHIAGARARTIPSVGHALSIALGDTLFGYALVGFLKKP